MECVHLVSPALSYSIHLSLLPPTPILLSNINYTLLQFYESRGCHRDRGDEVVGTVMIERCEGEGDDDDDDDDDAAAGVDSKR